MIQINTPIKIAVCIYISCIVSGIAVSYNLYGTYTLIGITAGVFVATMWCGLIEYITR